MKKKKLALTMAILLAINVIAIPGINVKNAKAATASTYYNSPYATVCKGSTGASVRSLQKFLNYLAYAYNKPSWNCGAVDGIFGTKTDKAVRAFQRDRGLVVDGICGPKTWDAMFALVS